MKNIDKLLSAINKVAAKKNMSSSTVANIDQVILQKAKATTTDLTKKFVDMMNKKKAKQPAAVSDWTLDSVLASVDDTLKSTFGPQQAEASAGMPFGGELYYSWYCDCSDMWLLVIEPLPPSYAAVLDYVPESEMYMFYNIPISLYLLGIYEPGAGEECWEYAGYFCFPIPAEGLITPMVGSSGI